jgi:Fic family protein
MEARRNAGSWRSFTSTGEEVRAFVPFPLPPAEPPLDLSDADHELIANASLALGRLDGVAGLLPDIDLFIYFYIRKEAVLSSQIEGTQSSMSDLLLFETEEAQGVPTSDVQTVSRYVHAMEHGLRRLRDEDGLPLSLRLMREIHERLLASGRGSDKTPGEFRRTQNWVGGTRPGNALYVPPPPDVLMECLGSLELFLHNQPARTPTLLKAALAHVQFETIHPFLDGNGRLGRLLITLLLCAEGVLTRPMLYLSLYFKTYRGEYYDLLQRVRTHGHWEEWIQFFMRGIIETAAGGVTTARRIRELFDRDRKAIEQNTSGTTARVGSMLQVHQFMQRRPMFSIADAAEATNLSAPTVSTCLEALGKQGIVKETTQKLRNRLFVYSPYVQILNEGTDQPFRSS